MASATRDIGERGAPSTGENRDANEAYEAEIVTGAASAPGTGAFLTRRQVARRLGLSLSTVRRKEGGELKPTIAHLVNALSLLFIRAPSPHDSAHFAN